MRILLSAFLFLLGLSFNIDAQYSRNGLKGLDFYAQGGLNFGGEYDVSIMKINDYIVNDSQELNTLQFRYGSTLKLFLNKVGLMVGYAIAKSGGVNKVAMSGTKFNLGLNFCLGDFHHKSPQISCSFNWGTRNYYFKNTLFVPSVSMNPSLISNEVNLLRYNQRSIGIMYSHPLASDDKSSQRLAIGLEYNLNSTFWNMGEIRIPEYGKSDVVFNFMYQVDFGYSRNRR
jgi:hypothetical protein